jgi:hypothetical protein
VVTADALHTHPDAAEFLVAGKQPTTCSRSKPISPPCWPAASTCPGTASPSWIPAATAATAAASIAPSRPSPSTTSGSPTPPRSCRSPARHVPCEPEGGGR